MLQKLALVKGQKLEAVSTSSMKMEVMGQAVNTETVTTTTKLKKMKTLISLCCLVVATTLHAQNYQLRLGYGSENSCGNTGQSAGSI